MQLTDGDEKCVLKLCVYKTPFGKSGHICTSYHGASADICNALARLARHLCTDYVDPAGLSAFAACCLTALDKCPGVWPISVGKVV